MIPWLLNNALSATFLAALAMLFIALFRPSPAIKHLLWLIVLLKLVVPTGLIWTVSLPFEELWAPPTPVIETQLAVEEGSMIDEELFVVEMSELSALESMPLLAANTPSEVPAVKPAYDLLIWAMLLWGTGGLLMAAWQISQTVRFARFANRSVPATGPLLEEVGNVARRLRVPMPEVRILAGLSSPVMWCLWKPVLLWPVGLDQRLKGLGRQAVIAHELAHLRRRDHWSRWLEMVGGVLHWWNPVYWLTRRRLRDNAELACDAWAVGQTDRRVYAEALLAVCSFNPRRRPAPAVGIHGEGRRAMQERLTMIMRERSSHPLALGAKLFVAVLAIAALPAWTLGQAKTEVKDVLVTVAVEGEETEATKLESQIAELQKKLAALKTANAVKKTKVAPKSESIRVTATADVANGTRSIKVLGADGKEMKDVKVIVIDGKESGTPKVIETKPDTLFFRVEPQVQVKGVQAKPVEKVVVGQVQVQEQAKPVEKVVVGQVQVQEQGRPADKAGEPAKVKTFTIKPDTVNFAGTKVITSGTDGIKIIGPDGKEMKDVKVIVVDPATVGKVEAKAKYVLGAGLNSDAGVTGTIVLTPHAPSKTEAKATTAPGKAATTEGVTGTIVLRDPALKTISPVPYIQRLYRNADGATHVEAIAKANPDMKSVTLSRATYKLHKDQATILASLLANIKATVMETKIDGDTIIVTTTPDVQAAVASMVKLLSSEEKGKRIQLELKSSEKPAKTTHKVEEESKKLKESDRLLLDMAKLIELKGKVNDVTTIVVDPSNPSEKAKPVK
jgi:beta-lactamase regulating signal transducer with metallopeptidase domain